jgi:hypothetical protein
MNTEDTLRHLTGQELLQAVVDSADLGKERQAHLQGCAACLQARAGIESRLARLGGTAQALAPLPARAFRLPEQRPAASSRRFKLAWAVGSMAVLFLLFAVGGPLWFHSPERVPVTAVDAAADLDFQLMAQIDALVDDALPVAYQALTAMEWPVLRIERPNDEPLIDWVVPPLDDDDDFWT